MTEVAGFERTEQSLQRLGELLPGFPLASVRLARLSAHLYRGIEDAVNRRLKPHGLNYTAYNMLTMLYGAPDFTSTPSALSEATGEKRTNITRLCDDLLKSGLIVRQPGLSDRRQVIVQLSPSGRALIETLLPEMWASVERLYAVFDDAERATLTRLLMRQLGNLDRGGE